MDVYEFKTSLVYKASFRKAWAVTQRNSISKHTHRINILMNIQTIEQLGIMLNEVTKTNIAWSY